MRRWIPLTLVFALVVGYWPGSAVALATPLPIDAEAVAFQTLPANDVVSAQHPDPASICFDLTGDGWLGIAEVQAVASWWRVRAGDPQWPEAAQYDFTESGDINVTDIMLVVAAMGVECPSDLPPDPADVAPPLGSSVTTTLHDATTFLYTGANPIQRDVDPDTIEPQRAAVIRGQVRDRDGAPLPGVTITVLNHPEFGYTYSRADGLFDLAVNGGGVLTLDYQKEGYLPAQRQVQAPWQDYVWAPDVAMIPLDERVTPIDLTEIDEIQVARGSLMNDDDGARQATLMFLPATTAHMVMPDGSTPALTSLSVRATEYTVGESGPEAMPAELPPNSGYTYAVEFSVDEALAAGASRVEFSQPVIFHLENFVGFPVGGAVPLGYYDRERGQWIASENGLVIGIVDIDGAGLAEVDLDGDGQANSAVELAALGITDGERAQLGQLYDRGQSLWRVPIPHFTPWDPNWPYGPPDDAEAPDPPSPPDPVNEKPCEQAGSIIECQTQSLRDTIPLVGSEVALHYHSLRVPGRKDMYRLDIPLSGDSVPDSLEGIELQVYVAGRSFRQSFPPLPQQSHTFTWDGIDAYGRQVQGRQLATVNIGYVYEGVFREPAEIIRSFARFGGARLEGVWTRRPIIIWRSAEYWLATWYARGHGLGGWTLGVHHTYDVSNRVIHRGDGTRRSVDWLAPQIITTAAGTGEYGFAGEGGPATEAQFRRAGYVAAAPDGSLYIADYRNHRIRWVDPGGSITTVVGTGVAGFSGDGGPATEAQLNEPWYVVVGPDGSLYIIDSLNNRVRRVDPDGIITTVAGTGPYGFTGDGGPATAARLNEPWGIAVAPDGSLYIADHYNNRIRHVGSDGIISTVAGTGAPGFSGDDGPATEARLWGVGDVDVASDGSVYIADYSNNRIRRIGTDGIITTVAGTGVAGFSGDGGPATEAELWEPWGVLTRPDGSFYIVDYGNNRIRRVGPEGIITTVVGTGEIGSAGDGGPATEAELWEPWGVSVAPDGSLYIADHLNNLVRRVAPPMAGFTGSDIFIPSADGEELYIFDPFGRHLQTLHTYTGATLWEFSYDEDGQLISITDGNDLSAVALASPPASSADRSGRQQAGNTLEVERDLDGNPTAIIAPFGQRTELTLDGEGYLASVTNPAGESFSFVYDDGLLIQKTDPREYVWQYSYDALGRLVQAAAPTGAEQTFLRTDLSNGFEVLHTSAEDRETRYRVERLPTEGQRWVTTTPSGARTEVTVRNGVQEAAYPDGTIVTLRHGPDPRFGMQTPLLAELTVTTPKGRTLVAGVQRDVTLTDPENFLSVERAEDTLTINGREYARVYDGETRELTVTTAAGREWIFEFDALGRPVRIDGGPDLDPSRFVYDERGLFLEIGQGSQAWDYAYDALGRVVSVETAIGQQFGYTYDAATRLISSTLPSGAVYKFEYNATEQPTRVVMPGNNVHEMDYTPTGRLSSYLAPDATTEVEWHYDDDWWFQRRVLPSGRTILWTYDDGRLVSEEYPEATVIFSYDTDDPTDRPHQLIWTPADSGPGQTITFDYDGALVTEVDWTGVTTGTFSFDYDDNFFLTDVTLVSDTDTVAVALTRDADGDLTGFGPFTITRDKFHQEVSGISDGTLEVALDYDTLERIRKRSFQANGQAIYDLELTYDDAGRIVARRETVTATTSVYEYGYNADSQLIAVRRDSSVVEVYGYDSNGNRVSRQIAGGAVESATYDSQDRLIEQAGVVYQFNDDGFLTARGDDTFVYSARGELLEASVDGQTVTYVYDAMGRRVARTDSGGTTTYLYGNQGDPFQVTTMRDTAGVLTYYYYDPNGLLYALERAGDRYLVATDQVGSPRVVADISGNIVRIMEYDSFGNRTVDTNPGFAIGIGFAGGLTDPITGMVWFGFRDYDPDAGRWTARDPILFASQQANLYVYVGNNPITLRDPMGLISLSGSLYWFGGGGFELAWSRGKGFSFCTEIGVGFGGGVTVDPFAGPASAGGTVVVGAEGGVGKAVAGVDFTLATTGPLILDSFQFLDPCAPLLNPKLIGGAGTRAQARAAFKYCTAW